MQACRRLLGALAIAFLAMATLAFTSPASLYTSSCTGTSSPTATLTCVGSCPAPGVCKTYVGTNANGQKYRFCACDASSEPACCHLVYNTTLGVHEVRGDCPSCPASGTCGISSSGGNKQAACTTGGGGGTS